MTAETFSLDSVEKMADAVSRSTLLLEMLKIKLDRESMVERVALDTTLIVDTKEA